MSFAMSVCPSAWNNSSPKGWIFMKFGIWVFLVNVSRKSNFHQNQTGIMGHLQGDQHKFLTMSSSFLLIMRNLSVKLCTENQNKHQISIAYSRIVPFYEIMWKNMVQPDRPQMSIWRMRIECWIPKATNIHWEYVIATYLRVFSTVRIVPRTGLTVTLYNSLHILLISSARVRHNTRSDDCNIS